MTCAAIIGDGGICYCYDPEPERDDPRPDFGCACQDAMIVDEVCAGCIRYMALNWDQTSAGNLVSDAAVLSWLRISIAGDYPSFRPHTIYGVPYRGAAVRHDVIIKMYLQGG